MVDNHLQLENKYILNNEQVISKTIKQTQAYKMRRKRHTTSRCYLLATVGIRPAT